MDEEVLLVERVRDHVLLVTLNRPARRNALSVRLTERLNEELARFDEDPDLWVMILTGAGDAFCSGMDLREYSEDDSGPARSRHRPRTFTGSGRTTVPTWKPIIAAVNGVAVAGGWSLAQHCDLRIAAETARFGVVENRWNLAAPFVAEHGVFPTSAVAAEIALMGRPISARRAYEIGFVNEVVPAEELLDTAVAWAEHLCTLGQEAVRGHKKLLHYAQWVPQSEIAELSRDVFYWMGEGKPGVVVDSTVGSRAFVEGGRPDFSRMFDPPRLACPVCETTYVVLGGSGGPVTCCGKPLADAAGRAGEAR